MSPPNAPFKETNMKTNRKTKKPIVGRFSEADLLKSVASFVGAIKGGKAQTLRSTTFELPDPLPPRTGSEVRAVRLKLGASQAVLASLLNTPARTVRSWENNQRKPSGAALKLLSIAEKHPEIFTAPSTVSAPKNTQAAGARSPSLIDGFETFFSGQRLPEGIKIVNANGERLADVRQGPDGRPMIFRVDPFPKARRATRAPVTRQPRKATSKSL